MVGSTSQTDERKSAAPSASSEHLSVFGAPLMSVAEVDEDGRWQLPAFLVESLDYIRRHGLDQEGVFRVSGISTDITQLKARIDLRLPVDFAQLSDVHSVTGLFKLYLRELPQPLIPFAFFEPFLRCFELEPARRKHYWHLLVWGLPGPHRLLCQALLKLLSEVIAKEDVNKMSAHNLAVVFAPTIMRPEVEDALAMVNNAQLLVDLVEHLIVSAPEFERAPSAMYHGLCRAVQSHHDDDDAEFLSFAKGDLLWIKQAGKATGWWLGHAFDVDPAASDVRAFPNAAVDVLVEFVERMPTRPLQARSQQQSAAVAAKKPPPPPGAPKPVSQSQRYDVVVDACLELCSTVEQLYAQVAALQRQNAALVAHCGAVDLAVNGDDAAPPPPSYIESLRALKAALAKTKTPSKPPPGRPGVDAAPPNRQLLLKEIQNSPLKSKPAASAPSPSSEPADALAPSTSQDKLAPRLPSTLPPPLPSSLPPTLPPACITPKGSPPTAAVQPPPTEPKGSPPVQPPEPKDAPLSRKASASGERVDKKKSRKSRSKVKRSSSRPSVPADVALTDSDSTSPRDSSVPDAAPATSSTEPATSSTEPATNSTEPATTSSTSTTEPAAGDEEVLVACWKCEEENAWDNVSPSVICAKCGEESFVQFE